MSAHDGRVSIDENFPFEPRHLRDRPHVHGLMFLENMELAEQVPPYTAAVEARSAVRVIQWYVI